jgi:hypothetical protein
MKVRHTCTTTQELFNRGGMVALPAGRIMPPDTMRAARGAARAPSTRMGNRQKSSRKAATRVQENTSSDSPKVATGSQPKFQVIRARAAVWQTSPAPRTAAPQRQKASRWARK